MPNDTPEMGSPGKWVGKVWSSPERKAGSRYFTKVLITCRIKEREREREKEQT